MRILTPILLLLLTLLYVGCRHDEYITFMTDVETGGTTDPTLAGIYVLNEGNMGSNKCTLDYLDLSHADSTAHYYRNIYPERNPDAVKELGDVGNDIGIYGQRLWIVVNCSNKVEVCHAASAERIGQVSIANARSLAFDGGYAYISSYAGPVQIDEHCPLGRVYKVDTLSLTKVDSVTVGYQPEEMAIVNGRLYVANSGGYRVPKYDNRVSMIDLTTFSQVSEMEVGINLHRMQADRYEQVWVSSRGDYFEQPSCLYWLSEDGMRGRMDIPVSAMTVVGDTLFYMGSAFSYLEGGYVKTFGLVNVRTHEVMSTNIFDAVQIRQMEMPYGLVVNPYRRDFYLMDAKNFVSSGELLHFMPDGTFDWKVRTGDIPSRAALLVR